MAYTDSARQAALAKLNEMTPEDRAARFASLTAAGAAGRQARREARAEGLVHLRWAYELLAGRESA